MRFFGPRLSANAATSSSVEKSVSLASISDLATEFATHIPQHEFSTAEIQGFLLSCKKDPQCAVEHVREWIENELSERREKANREAERKAKVRAKREEVERRHVDSAMAKVGEGFGKIMAHGGMMAGNSVSGLVAPTPTQAGTVGTTTPISVPVTPSPAYEDTTSSESLSSLVQPEVPGANVADAAPASVTVSSVA